MRNREDLLSIDGGYASDKWAKFVNGELKFGSVVSAFADAPSSADDMPFFEGRRYYVGDVALMEDSSDIKNITGYKDRESFAPLSIWHVMSELGLKKEDVNYLCVGLSLAQKKYSAQFVKRVSKFKVNKEVYDFSNKVFLVPQAVAAKYAIDYFYDLKGSKETYVIIDIGLLTIDVVTVINGFVRRENAAGVENEGLIKVLQDIQELIASKFGDVISLKEAQEVLLTKEYFAGQGHNLEEEIREFVKSYNKFLSVSLPQRYKNLFKKFPKLYFVGGGGYYIDKDLIASNTDAIADNLIVPKNCEHLNAIGGLLIAIEEANKSEG